MKKILCITPSLNCGGAETWIMKIFRELDKSEYCIDFCLTLDGEHYYTKEVLSYGGKIYVVPPKRQSLLKNLRATQKLIKKNNYAGVLRLGGIYIHILDLLVARFSGSPKIALRSINSNTDSKFANFLSYCMKPLHRFLTPIKIAPSTEAAEFVWGKESVKRGEVIFFPNALPFESYSYSLEKRKKFQMELGIEGKFVVGHIGRFSPQKNHIFLLEVFAEIYKQNSNAILCLCGAGVLEEEVRVQAKTLAIQDAVIFLGLRNDIGDVLSGFDVFLFPSLYEGMPNTVLEAQASGLPCIISDSITKECDITGLVNFVPLEKSPREWAEKVRDVYSNAKRVNTQKDFIAHGYDIESAVQKFMNLFFTEHE